MKNILFLLSSLLLVSAAWARGPYNFPDQLNCYLNDPEKDGYTSGSVKIAFEHVEKLQASQFLRKAKIELRNSKTDKMTTIENVDLYLTFENELRTALAMRDGKPLFIISRGQGQSYLTPLTIDPEFLPLHSTSDACLHLDGTAARPGLSGSNRSRN